MTPQKTEHQNNNITNRSTQALGSFLPSVNTQKAYMNKRLSGIKNIEKYEKFVHQELKKSIIGVLNNKLNKIK